MKKRFKWSTKSNDQKRDWPICVITVLAIGLMCCLSEWLNIPLLFEISSVFIVIPFLIHVLKFFLNDLVDTENFEGNFWAYTCTYMIAFAICFYWYTRKIFDCILFKSISISLMIFWLLYFIACIRILYKLNVGEKKIWWITIIKSACGGLGAWGAIGVLLFSTENSIGNCDIDKLFYLSTRIISSGAAFFYPILDMYLYTRQKINEYQKSLLKEKKNESKDNKNSI